jgi:hypothetical protein
MNEVENQIHQVERSVEEAKAFIAKSDALARLEKNEDFKFLVIEGILKDDAVRVVMALASPNAQSEEVQGQFKRRQAMIGELYNYLHYVHVEGDQARTGMAEYENTREELLAEQLGAEVM